MHPQPCDKHCGRCTCIPVWVKLHAAKYRGCFRPSRPQFSSSRYAHTGTFMLVDPPTPIPHAHHACLSPRPDMPHSTRIFSSGVNSTLRTRPLHAPPQPPPSPPLFTLAAHPPPSATAPRPRPAPAATSCFHGRHHHPQHPHPHTLPPQATRAPRSSAWPARSGCCWGTQGTRPPGGARGCSRSGWQRPTHGSVRAT